MSLRSPLLPYFGPQILSAVSSMDESRALPAYEGTDGVEMRNEGVIEKTNASLLGGHWRDFVADLRRIQGVQDPIEINVSGSLTAGVALYVLDGMECPTDGICEQFRYRLNPLLVDRLDEAGEVFFRPLLDASFRAISDDILYLDLLQTPKDFHGKGIGSTYYRHLQSLARRLGYRFLGHRHIDRTAHDFFLRRGCPPLDDIKPEFRPLFEVIEQEDPGVPGWNALYTLSFLDPDDAARYL